MLKGESFLKTKFLEQIRHKNCKKTVQLKKLTLGIIRRMQMFEDQILNDFIDHAVDKAKKNIRETGNLEIEDAIPLMLKSQFNHIAHLEKETMPRAELGARFSHIDQRFEAMDYRFDVLEKQFGFMKWMVGIGFSFLGALQIYIGFIH